MEVRVLILSPFHYNYGNKNFFAQVGDSLYFDPSKEEEKEELKFILSPKSEYRKWVWVEESEVSFLLDEIKKEFEGVPVDVELKEGLQSSNSIPSNLDDVPSEPEESIFLKPEIKEVIKETPEVLEESKPSEKEVLKRQLELETLHYTKIQKIAEGLGVEYSDKPETIKEILKVEFNLKG